MEIMNLNYNGFSHKSGKYLGLRGKIFGKKFVERKNDLQKCFPWKIASHCRLRWVLGVFELKQVLVNTWLIYCYLFTLFIATSLLISCIYEYWLEKRMTALAFEMVTKDRECYEWYSSAIFSWIFKMCSAKIIYAAIIDCMCLGIPK